MEWTPGTSQGVTLEGRAKGVFHADALKKAPFITKNGLIIAATITIMWIAGEMM
jgi:hypothetical protein